jgi:hypothetical protein
MNTWPFLLNDRIILAKWQWENALLKSTQSSVFSLKINQNGRKLVDKIITAT